jgi:hypothetical protein
VAIVGTSAAVVPLIRDAEPAAVTAERPDATRWSPGDLDGVAGTSAAPAASGPAPDQPTMEQEASAISLGGGDNGLPTDISALVMRAYAGCLVWSKSNWPRQRASVTDQGQVYAGGFAASGTGSKIAYLYRVFSDQEIHFNPGLQHVDIVLEAPREGATPSESIFYLRYELTSGKDGAQLYDLVDAQCR